MSGGGLLEKAQNIDETDDEPAPVTAEPSEQISGETSDGLLARTGALEQKSDDGKISGSMKMGIAGGIVALLVLFILYQFVMGFSFGGHSISVAHLEMDEGDNALRVQVFIGTPMIGGVPSDDVNIEIYYGNENVHTATFAPKGKIAWYEIPFADFYQGNSRGVGADSADVNYTFIVGQGSSTSSTFTAEGSLMDRTITAVDGQLGAVTQPNDNCEDGSQDAGCDKENNGLDHIGTSFRVGVGVPDPVESNASGILLHVDSDYTISASIQFDGDDVFTFPTVTVDGSTATYGGSSGIVENAWIDLRGEGQTVNQFGETEYYIPRDSFYQEDGCYTVSITVTHTSPFGDSYTNTSGQGYEFFWEYNENRDTEGEDTSDPPDGVADTEGEPYKPTEAC